MFKGKKAKPQKDVNREDKTDYSAKHIVFGKINDAALDERTCNVKE